MSVEIITVAKPIKQGWGEWALEQAKERPYLAALAAPVAVALLPYEVGVVAVTAGAMATVGAIEVWRSLSGHTQVTIIPAVDADSIIDIDDQPLIPGVSYMRHPQQSQHAVIIKSSKFHETIMKQIVSEIVTYLRAETRISKLHVMVRSTDNKNAVVGGKLKAIPTKANFSLQNQSGRNLYATYDNPSKLPHQRPYIWIGQFPEVIAATRSAGRGTMSFRQIADMSFGLSADAAKVASFNVGWLTSFEIEIEATFA